MTVSQPANLARRFPAFLDRWLETNGEELTPVSYLNQQPAVPVVLAAQWLFVPDFVEYRTAIFWSDSPSGLREIDENNLDGLFAKFTGDPARVERIGNLLTLRDLLVACDLAQYESDLPELARTIARSWDALLRAEFPDRTFRVEVFDEESSGPQLTFFRAPRPGGGKTVVHDIKPGFEDVTQHGIHVDFPPTHWSAFARANRQRAVEIDLRGLATAPDLSAVQPEIIGFIGFEQFWVKREREAKRLLGELLPAMSAARAAGHDRSVALVHLSSAIVDVVLAELRHTPAPDPAVPLFRYSPVSQ